MLVRIRINNFLQLPFTGGHAKCCKHFGRQLSGLTKLNVLISFDVAIELLGIYIKDFENSCPSEAIKNVYDSFIHNFPN